MTHIYSNLIDTPLETLIERIAALPVDRMFINNPYTPAGKLRAALAALPAGTCFTNHQLTPEATLSQALTALAPNVEHRAKSYFAHFVTKYDLISKFIRPHSLF
jgi:hypothetical protein